MKRKTLALAIIVQIFFCQLVFGQERGVVIKVKQTSGQKQDEVLYRNSYALLIGNSNYSEWNSLPGVERDIPQIETVLRDKHGFVVEKALNLSKNELRSRIDQFISKYGQDYENRLLIYYAGHGYTAVLPDKRVMGYLVMKDAPVVPPVEETLIKTPKNLGEFRLNAVSMDEIENLAKEISTRHALFVFDSCFSGTALYRDNVINVPQEISSEELEQMRGFLTAGNEKQRVRDDSPFRRAFIKGLEGKADTNGDGYILSSELGAFVKREVYLETRNTATPQSPIFGKQTNFTRGDMVFEVPKKDSLSPAQIAWNNFRGLAKTLLKYDGAFSYSADEEGLIMVKIGESPTSKYGFVNKFGNQVTPVKYDQIAEFSEGMTSIELNDKWGFIDKTGKEIILPKYGNVYRFSEGFAKVQIGDYGNRKSGFIDKSGKEITPIKYDDVSSFSEGLAEVKIGDKWGFINNKGIEVIPIKYDDARQFSEGMAGIKLNGKWGFIDKTGKMIIPPKYDYVYWFSEGLARVKLNDKLGFIDKRGKEVISIKYKDPNISLAYTLSFTNGIALVLLDDKLSFIDKTGKTVIPLKSLYYIFLPFSEGFLSVGLNGKWGVIDKTGKEITPFKYNYVEQFLEGLARINLNGKYGFIDKTGKEIIPPIYDSVTSFSQFLSDQKYNPLLSGDVIIASINSKVGFLNEKGEVIVPFKYENLWCVIKEGFIGVTLNGKKGFVDIYGNEYFDF